jgi:Icc-related predicted phosphoesterase
MRILPLSDLHMETTRGWDLPPLAELPEFDVAVFAGDLTTRMERGVRWIDSRLPGRECVYIAGNHEAFGADIDVTVAKAREAAKGTAVHVLQNDLLNINGVDFIGFTLWTNFNLFGDPHAAMTAAGDRMNDFKRIRVHNYRRKFRPPDALARHDQSISFLEKELARSEGRKQVVVSHHRPTAQGYRYFETPDGSPDVLNAAYCSELRDLFVDGPAAWIFGHTHESFHTTLGRTRLISNAKGYGPWPGVYSTQQNQNFNTHFTFEI